MVSCIKISGGYDQYLDAKSFKEKYVDKVVIKDKFKEVENKVIEKIAVFRDYIHKLHESAQIKDKWDKSAIPLDILQQIENPDEDKMDEDEEEEEEKSKPLSLIRSKPYGGSIWDEADQTTTSDSDNASKGLGIDIDAAIVNPSIIKYSTSSLQIAKESVSYYLNQIHSETQIFRQNTEIIDKMYADGKKYLWCLNGYPKMYYFVRIGLHSLAAAGTNTPAERGMKKAKWFGTPERNRLKGESLNILNTIHEKVVADELDYNLRHGDTETAEDCVEIMKLFGYHESQEIRYAKLIDDITTRSKKLYAPRMFIYNIYNLHNQVNIFFNVIKNNIYS